MRKSGKKWKKNGKKSGKKVTHRVEKKWLTINILVTWRGQVGVRHRLMFIILDYIHWVDDWLRAQYFDDFVKPDKFIFFFPATCRFPKSITYLDILLTELFDFNLALLWWPIVAFLPQLLYSIYFAVLMRWWQLFVYVFIRPDVNKGLYFFRSPNPCCLHHLSQTGN